MSLLRSVCSPFTQICIAFPILIACSLEMPLLAQVPGQSTNMVTGTQWPGGDPFLERQNEPSMAVSSRNPLHLVAGNNDYRTVDLPGLPTGVPTGDAWLGFFTSFDGGDTWSSVLVPGYQQDSSAQGLSSPLKGYEAGADPYVRAGTNGLFYYSGLAFNRETNGTSAVFLARYIDDNNLQGSNTIRYLGTSVVATGGATNFLDKPSIAVDIPRSGSGTCTIPASATVPAATIPAGKIYMAYTQFVGPESSNVSAIMFSYSSDCGNTWSKPEKISGPQQTNQGAALAVDPATGNVYIVWRIFAATGQSDAIAGVAFHPSTGTLSNIVTYPITPFDQGTTDISFRTNAYPAIALDGLGNIYVAWSQRGSTSNSVTKGDARITVISAALLPTIPLLDLSLLIAAPPIIVDNYQGRGHQIMPALSYSSGKLTAAWYDFRNDDEIAVYTPTGGGAYSEKEEIPTGVTPVFSTFVADPTGPPYPTGTWRHTVDIRAAQAPPGFFTQFKPSVLVSSYDYGTPAFDPSTSANLPSDPDNIQQLDFDAPNLPLFQLGTVPFVGDYIDIAGPTFIPYMSGSTQMWRFNNLATDPDQTHVVWTDNRNVVQPADGNWAHYTPVGATGTTQSIYEPGQIVPACVVGQTGNRNQDIYTARISPGLIMGSKGNAKQLSTTLPREFPVTVENPTSATAYFELQIPAQPTGGTASFLQYATTGLPNPLTTLYVAVPPLSTASRSVFVTSSNPNATVSVTATQTTVNNNVIAGGLTSSVELNSDVSNPNISNPNISNVEIYNPNISNPNISNPNISNPNISNPNISNPNISNPNISNPNISNVAFANPNISNPNISNPNISNPNISNPNISNPNISNASLSGEITDDSYTVTNSGNTATSYVVQLVASQQPTNGVTLQLIISGVYFTPTANGCSLAEVPHYVPIANVPNPTLVTPGSVLPSGPPATTAPSFSLQPGEEVVITVRVYDPNATTPAQALKDYNPATALTPVITSPAVNTNLPKPPANLTILAISTSTLPAVNQNATYSTTLKATGGYAPYTWTAKPGTLPAGITLSTAGVLTGSPTVSGTYNISVQVSDSSGQSVQKTLSLVVNVAIPSLSIATTSFPVGTFGLPYSTALSATGGVPPYTWSTAAVLPAGTQLASNGVLSGNPGQSGAWYIPVTVTDSKSSTQTATLSLSVGLPVVFSGPNNCYEPMQAIPLYYSGAAGWQLTSNLVVNSDSGQLSATGQLNLITGDSDNGAVTYLSGCLTGEPDGIYQVVLIPQDASNNPLATITFNLNVVGFYNQDNGLVNATTGVVGNLPPYGYDQGIVFTGQSFNALNAGNADPDSESTLNFLLGFQGSTAPALCFSDTSNTPNITAPSAPGLYAIFLNGTTSTCPVSSYPTNYSNLVVSSVDVLQASTTFNGVTVSNVVLSSSASYAFSSESSPYAIQIPQQPGGGAILPVTVSFSYSATTPCTSANCQYEIEVGANTSAGPTCAANPTYTGGVQTGTGNATFYIPNVTGRYYIGIDAGPSPNGCTYTWTSGPPSASRYIGIVDITGNSGS